MEVGKLNDYTEDKPKTAEYMALEWQKAKIEVTNGGTQDTPINWKGYLDTGWMRRMDEEVKEAGIKVNKTCTDRDLYLNCWKCRGKKALDRRKSVRHWNDESRVSARHKLGKEGMEEHCGVWFYLLRLLICSTAITQEVACMYESIVF